MHNPVLSAGCDPQNPDRVRHRPEVQHRPWVWLDLDDTLYDFEANSLTALQRLYTEQGLRRWWPDVRTWIDEYHAVNSELWKQYSRGEITRDYLRMERFRRPLTARGCDDASARALSAQLDPIYLDHLAHLDRTVPGAIDLLERLFPLYNIGVLSNGFREVQYGKMHSAGLAGYVDCTVLSDEIDINKPDVRLYRYAQRKAGVKAGECLLIGDNPDTDIKGALDAGWKAIYFAPKEKDPAITIETLHRAPQVLSLAQIWPVDDLQNGLLGLNLKKSM